MPHGCGTGRVLRRGEYFLQIGTIRRYFPWQLAVHSSISQKNGSFFVNCFDSCGIGTIWGIKDFRLEPQFGPRPAFIC